MTATAHVRDLSRSFGTRTVLSGIDLDIARNEFVALVGHSGTGKSTLLRVLSGYDEGFTGQVEVAPRRAMVYQEPRLLPWARVLDNVVIGLRGRDVTELGRAALHEVGLADKERAWPVTLSGGEAQRVGLARALVRDPQLLLLDEPFAALDALTTIRMRTLLQQLCRRHTPGVLLVTHDVDEALLLADRVLVLDEGRFVLDLPVRLGERPDASGADFGRLRATLLDALGVREPSHP